MRKLLLISIISIATIIVVNAQSIYEIQGQTEESPYADQEVTTKGIVTATYNNSYFIQDGDSAWTGLYIYDQTQTPTLGDSIQITGTLVEYYGMTELKDITEFTVLSSGNTLPQPILLETGGVEEKWESVLVKVENATCTNTDMGYGEWEINDGSGPLVVNDLGIAYTPILDVNYHITGPLDYSFGAYKIEPRTAEDIIQDLSLFFIINPYAENISKTGFDISWETNIEASSYIEYGLTTDYETGVAFSTVSSTTATISIDNLEPGNIYYAKSYAINMNNDTTPIHHGVYVTQSESTGKINSYFNYVEPNIITKGNYPGEIIDTTLSYINKAEISLDITLYDLTNHAPQSDSSNYLLIRAINNAFDRGVTIRFITDDSPVNHALDSLNPSIPLVRGNSDGIMHNKFLIIDSESVENSWILTGSTNWTYNNLYMDFNNVVCIQDQSLAKAYEIEFNEMWGSNTLTPDLENGKFGKEKLDNTPHYFNINDTDVELYFSPSDKTASKIVNAISNAESSVDFAMMVFTDDNIGNALVSAHNNSISVQGIIDYVEYSGSEFDNLKNNGVEVYDYKNLDETSWPDGTTLHHKFCIIDKENEKPLVVTGTHNWSASADSKNDENTLFIYNKTLANSFIEEYNEIESRLFDDIQPKESNSTIKVFPNPSLGEFQLIFENEGSFIVSIYDISGREIQKHNLVNNTIIISIKRKGMFIIEVTNELNKKSRQKVIIQ